MKSLTSILLLFTLLSLLTISTASVTTVRQAEDPEEMDMEPTISPEESPEEDDPVCVETSYLTRLGHPPSNLVHRRSILANAYCPPAPLPCGTRHHRLRLNGKDLSYESYCQQVSCQRRLVEVNSVWSHVWQDRVEGHVVLTMMDHRWSEAPQKLLHRVMSTVRNLVP